MNKIQQIFASATMQPERLSELEALPDPRSRYIVAMTPRSGSSYLCDVMAKTKRFGRPGEMLNPQHLPKILPRIPGRTPAQYFRNVLRVNRSINGLSGVKASWFQFALFQEELLGEGALEGVRFIYLTRRNLPAQAVSLYKATESNVFHTNISHSEEELGKLQMLQYDYGKIDSWYKHIAQQETGWEQFFYEQRIRPLCITYEQAESDLLFTLKRIARHVAVPPENIHLPAKESTFRRVSDDRNMEWTHRYVAEKARRQAQAATSASSDEQPAGARP